MRRTILHIDMNAFFASVEQQDDPQLRGRPIAVTGRGSRAIVTTASYEARAYGVKTGMPVAAAQRLCPELQLVIGNHRRYSEVSSGIIALLRDYTPLVEVFSIDEAFLDLTGCERLCGPADEVARQIKARIRERFGLTCSIGIAPNKLLAKLASELQKPDGLTILAPEAIPALLETLPVGELCGIGRATQEELALLNIRTCGDLGRASAPLLQRKFGINGPRLQAMGRGEDDSPVIPEEESAPVKSVGHSTTFDRDLTERGDLQRILLQLAEMVGRRARRYGVSGRTVTLTVRYADFTTFSTRSSGRDYDNSSSALHSAACALLDRLTLEQPVRLLGLTLSNLRHASDQLSLFADGERQRQLAAAMDRVNDRFGNSAVTFGTILDAPSRPRVIAPSWRPDGIRRSDAD